MDALLTPGEVGKILGDISLETLRRWRQQGTGPRYLKLGRHIRYDPSDVREWRKAQTVGRGSQGAR